MAWIVGGSFIWQCCNYFLFANPPLLSNWSTTDGMTLSPIECLCVPHEFPVSLRTVAHTTKDISLHSRNLLAESHADVQMCCSAAAISISTRARELPCGLRHTPSRRATNERSVAMVSSAARALGTVALAAALSPPPGAVAVVPTGSVSLSVPSGSPQFADMLCAPSAVAGWGVPLPEQYNSRWKHVLSLPAVAPSNARGCDPYTLPSPSVLTASAGHGMHGMHGTSMTSVTKNLSTVVVVDRGNCSFLHKARMAEQAGARGLVVRGTKEAIYEAVRAQAPHSNESAVVDASALPLPPFEFDCARGEAFVTRLASPEWRTDTAACYTNDRCESNMCVLTGATRTMDSQLEHQVCCMFDTYVIMGGGNRSQAANVTIPVVYMTVRDGQQLDRALTGYPSLLMRTFRRDVPLLDVASMLLWALGVSTAIGAAYYSAAHQRHAWRRRRRQLEGDHDGELGDEGHKHLDLRHPHDAPRRRRSSSGPEAADEIWELDTRHAVGFIVFAALFLTVLFYVKVGITVLVPVLFTVAGTTALAQVAAAPALRAFVPAVASRQLHLPFPLSFLIDEPVPLADFMGLFPSAALAIGWYVHRRTWWPVQDAMGVALCFVFLRSVQLPNLKVATVLLSLAFCYDIFFVFLSPLVFGRSVMEDVATGGPAAYTRKDYPGIDYCERYPKEIAACIEPEPMPMLLVLPRVLTWLKGESMLGLGDIILPGMVLSLALRFDYAPKTVGGANYFKKAAVGYAVGLAMANTAVALMDMGQPALMYLVPTTLGTLIVSLRKNGSDFRAMWTGAGLEDEEDDEFRDERYPGDASAVIDVNQERSGSNNSRADEGRFSEREQHDEQSSLLIGSSGGIAPTQAGRGSRVSANDIGALPVNAPLLGAGVSV